ncbi:putative terminase large subunit [Staphylococcus phage vB_SauM_VL10]|nr:putative terminase large subunit [Staphylococcus phage vB_SauM_VL10]
MNAVWISADQLVEKEMNTESKQAFYNYSLGMPYEDVKMRVLPEDIFENKSEIAKTQLFNRDKYKFISCSVDWGKQLPPRISDFSSKTLLNGETLSA